jgi:hypothetical protein
MKLQELIDKLLEIQKIYKVGRVVVQSDAIMPHKFTGVVDGESGVLYLEIAPAVPYVDYWTDEDLES